jgi:hypothetical protein
MVGLLFVCEFAMSDTWSEEETDDPVYADERDFLKVEEWTADDLHVARLIYAGNRLEKSTRHFRRRHSLQHCPALLHPQGRSPGR